MPKAQVEEPVIKPTKNAGLTEQDNNQCRQTGGEQHLGAGSAHGAEDTGMGGALLPFRGASSRGGASMVVVIVVALIAIPATVVEVLEFLEGPGI